MPATQVIRLKAVRKSKRQREISPNSLQPKQPVFYYRVSGVNHYMFLTNTLELRW